MRNRTAMASVGEGVQTIDDASPAKWASRARHMVLPRISSYELTSNFRLTAFGEYDGKSMVSQDALAVRPATRRKDIRV